MPATTIQIPSVFGGVSRQPPSLRNRDQVEAADNVVLRIGRGCEPRAGSKLVLGTAADGSLDASGASSTTAKVLWFERDEWGKFVLIIDGSLSDDRVIQAFDILGNRVSVATPSAEILTYLRSGTGSSAQNVDGISVADATFLFNRTVRIISTGGSLNYTFNNSPVRNSGNAHNKADFSEFDFPPAASGEYWYAQEDSPGRPAGFYVSQNHSGPQPWYARVRSESSQSEIDPTKMPIRLTFDPTTGFTASQIEWTPRYAGDSSSHPRPSFVGRRVDDLAFFRNRLWFGSDEQIVASRDGEYFNFWQDSDRSLVDADRIDTSLTGDVVSHIQHLIPFNRSMIAFTESGRQYEVRSVDIMSPTTATVVQSTAYRTRRGTRPQSMGRQLYFVGAREDSLQLYEYIYSDTSAGNIAPEVTEHVEGYIPAGDSVMSCSLNHNQIFITPASEARAVYVYQMTWSGDQKVQSAWCRWVFDPSYRIVSHRVFDDSLFLLVARGGRYWLESVRLGRPEPDAGLPFSLRMDAKVAVETGVYNAASNRTTWTLPVLDSTINVAVLGSGPRAGLKINASIGQAGGKTTVSCLGNLSSTRLYAGRSYSATVLLSEIKVRDQEGSAVAGVLSLRTLTVDYKDTTELFVRVESEGREARETRFRASYLNAIAGRANAPVMETGDIAVRLGVAADRCKITIGNDSPFPFSFGKFDVNAVFVPAKSKPVR